MYMLRYKFREAADLQGGVGEAFPPKCTPDIPLSVMLLSVFHCIIIDY